MRKFKEDHLQSVNYFLKLYENNISHKEIERYFKSFGLTKVTNEFLKNIVLRHGSILFRQSSADNKFSAIIHNNTYYLLVEHSSVEILFESREKIPANNFFLLIFLAVFVLIAWLYVSTIKSIKPIRDFRKLVRKFADGDTSVQFDYNGKDEVGELSQEFNKATKTITNLYNSRTLFLRTIMHELKTPIGKGRIVAEMVDDETQRGRLIKVFKRLEILINEISKVEQLVTNKYQMEKKVCKLKDIFKKAFNILLMEQDQFNQKVSVDLGTKPFRIDVDEELMALVFKNLTDNALKYGSDNFVQITLKKDVLYFINKGNPLEKPIEEYRQAFMTSSKYGRKGGGMGLGLYIVDSILGMHELKLNYEYKDGYHYFFIKLIEA